MWGMFCDGIFGKWVKFASLYICEGGLQIIRDLFYKVLRFAECEDRKKSNTTSLITFIKINVGILTNEKQKECLNRSHSGISSASSSSVRINFCSALSKHFSEVTTVTFLSTYLAAPHFLRSIKSKCVFRGKRKEAVAMSGFRRGPRFHQRSINGIKGGSICLAAENGLSLIPWVRTAGLDSLDQSFRQLKDGSSRDVYEETDRFKFFSLTLPFLSISRRTKYQPFQESYHFDLLAAAFCKEFLLLERDERRLRKGSEERRIFVKQNRQAAGAVRRIKARLAGGESLSSFVVR